MYSALDKTLYFISQDKEMSLIQSIIHKVMVRKPNWHPSDTLFICVSPDYSGIIAQHMAHSLTVDGEIYHIESVNVPFPDESRVEYELDFLEGFHRWKDRFNKYVLIEAGVIRGGNYTWITRAMRRLTTKEIYTVAMCENIHSKFKSDFVGEYYNDDEEDLHFWWERPNNHWDWRDK